MEAIVSCGVFLFLDQWSKSLVQIHATGRPISFGSLLRFRYVKTLKALYGSNAGRAALVLVWFVALACAILLHRSGVRFQSHAALIGLGLAFGGAAGNLLDILRRRFVVDFIDLHWWPVFNLADVGILGGLLVAFWPRS